MIHPKKKLIGLSSQESNLHSAYLSLSKLQVIPIWWLLNNLKGMCGSFQQTLMGEECVTNPKRVGKGG